MMNQNPLLAGLLGGLMAVVLFGLLGTVWTGAGYEGALGVAGLITDATPADQIDDFIRDERKEVRWRSEVEHFWADGDTLTHDNGLHRLGSARCYMSNTAPTELSDSHTGVAATTIADYDNTASASFSGEPDLNNPATNSVIGAGDEDDVGHGRCWIDMDGADNVAGTWDDNKMWIFRGVAGAAGGPVAGCVGTGWCAVDASTRPGGDDEILAGAYNLIYNGSFEIASGTGDPTIAVVPVGWTAVGPPAAIGYVDPSDDAFYGDGYHLTVQDGGGGGGDYVYQRLNFRENTTFKVMARVESNGAATCRMSSSGAAAETGNQDTTSATWVTLTGYFTTISPDVVDIRLTTVTAGATCDWDHIAVYRVGDVDTDRDEISLPSVVALYDSDNGVSAVNDGAYATVPNLELVFTAPNPGWTVQVGYSISAASAPGVAEIYLKCLLDDNVTGNLVTTAQSIYTEPNWVPHKTTLSNVYLERNPVAGLTYTYTVRCLDWSFDMQYNDDALGPATDNYSSLWLTAFPPR